jgi:excisionase family DNA binding protein
MNIDPALKPITVRVRDACRMTGIGRSKLYLLIEEGEIEIIKVGSMTLIPVASLEAFLEGRKERR